LAENFVAMSFAYLSAVSEHLEKSTGTRIFRTFIEPFLCELLELITMVRSTEPTLLLASKIRQIIFHAVQAPDWYG
jgi:hypothetical protein